MAGTASFQEIFDALKLVFEEYAGRLAIQVDEPGQYYLETKSAIRQGRRLQFGGVQIGKAHCRAQDTDPGGLRRVQDLGPKTRCDLDILVSVACD
jgi:hypothetical protein